MDSYIDNQETQTYGPKLSGNLRRLFAEHSEAPVVTFMAWCAAKLDAASATMNDAMTATRQVTSERGEAVDEKLPAVDEARASLKAFHLNLQSKKADAEEPWNGDLELFVPGGLTAIGRGARSVCNAVQTAHDALDRDADAPDRDRWIKRFAKHLKALTPLIARAELAAHANLSTLSEQSAEKRAWLRTYRGVALVLEGVLMLLGRSKELTANVPHLTAPDTRKKSDAKPPVPPA